MEARAQPVGHRGVKASQSSAVGGVLVAELRGPAQEERPGTPRASPASSPAHPPAASDSLPSSPRRAGDRPRCRPPGRAGRARAGAGTPRSSQSLNLKPGRAAGGGRRARGCPPSELGGELARRPSARRPAGRRARSGRSRPGRGASRGGSTRPLSSPWAMMTAPIMRVDMPQDVVWHSSCRPASVLCTGCRRPWRSWCPGSATCRTAAPCRRASCPRS